jgi:superoxide dismutase
MARSAIAWLLVAATTAGPAAAYLRATGLVNQWAMDHTTSPAGGRPILALEMYEHSYHLDYGAGA